MAIAQCPRCGMRQHEWQGNGGHGFTADDGALYCCQGCAEQTGCTCRNARTPETKLDHERDESAQQIPQEGIAGKEELLGQESTGPMNPKKSNH